MKKDEKMEEVDFSDHTRDLSSTEYANLYQKAEKGAFPVDYLRKNLFYPTTKEEKNVPTNFKKIIHEDKSVKIAVNKYLHQRHSDVLRILFTDNFGVSTPLSDGTYYIYTNLTHIAKELGYANPNSSVERVKELLSDLRNTEIIITTTSENNGKTIETGGHRLLGEYKLDIVTNQYCVEIPNKTAKYHILNFAVEIPKQTNQRILKIPHTKPRLKATITYLLSNKILKNGIGLDTIMNMLNIDTPKTKSTFKKEIEENIAILKEFNIDYNEDTKKFQLEKELTFYREVTTKQAIDSYIKDGKIEIVDLKKKNKSGETNDFEDYAVKDIPYLEMVFVDKYIRVQDNNYLIKKFSIEEYLENEETKKQVVIETVIGKDIVKKIGTKMIDFEKIYTKVANYNKEYLDYCSGLKVEF